MAQSALQAQAFDESEVSGAARLEAGALQANARFQKLAAGEEPWRWLNGPHAKVRYASLEELVRGEAATLAPVPYLSRFERDRQVLEVRLEKLKSGVCLALVHDVTAEVRRQREQQQEREALLYEDRMHAMGVLASGVAHDLNHVLNVIGLRVATLRADPAVKSAWRTFDGLSKVVGDAARVVGRLQDLARKRRDRPSDPLDLAAVLTGAIEMARTESDVAGVRIEAEVPPLPLVRGSAAELTHVFGCLLLHAREQMLEGGVVRVRAREERGKVCVTIADGGPGTSEENLARLFDPFSGVAGGSALGLAVAWGVMTRLGGSLSASSRPGEGTTFSLGFPLAAPLRRETAAAKPPERRRRRILIVDDEADNLEVLREVLELEGHTVESAGSGPEALDFFRRGEGFDLVLCDVGMPEMSGWQVAREIGRLAAGTPVWMLTGWANEIGEGDPRRKLVRGVLGKPLDLPDLRKLIDEVPARRLPGPTQESAATH